MKNGQKCSRFTSNAVISTYMYQYVKVQRLQCYFSQVSTFWCCPAFLIALIQHSLISACGTEYPLLHYHMSRNVNCMYTYLFLLSLAHYLACFTVCTDNQRGGHFVSMTRSLWEECTVYLLNVNSSLQIVNEDLKKNIFLIISA